jgi:hypothetical protein
MDAHAAIETRELIHVYGRRSQSSITACIDSSKNGPSRR